MMIRTTLVLIACMSSCDPINLCHECLSIEFTLINVTVKKTLSFYERSTDSFIKFKLILIEKLSKYKKAEHEQLTNL